MRWQVAREDTDGAIGVPEFILVTCGAGVLQSLLGPQPLIVVRPTGPVVLVGVQLWELSKRIYPEDPNNLDPDVIIARFLGLSSAVGLFVGLFMAIIAAFELSRFCTRFTRFTLEIFETFVCGVTFSLGAERVASKFLRDFNDEWRFGDALFSFALSACTFVLSLIFSSASKHKMMNPWLRRGVSDYALLLAVGATIGVSFWVSDPEDARVERIPAFKAYELGFPVEPTAQREWWVGFSAFREIGGSQGTPPWWLPLVACVAALPITAYLYVEQNVTGILLQQPAAKLRKGSYFHGTVLLASLFNGLAPLFGLPFISYHLSPQLRPALTIVAMQQQQQRRRDSSVVSAAVAKLPPRIGNGNGKQMSPRAPPEQPNRPSTSQPTAAAAAAASVGAAFPGARATFSGLPSAKLVSTKVASAAAAATAPNSQGQLRTQGKDTSALVTVVSENRLVCSQAACNILISYMQYTHLIYAIYSSHILCNILTAATVHLRQGTQPLLAAMPGPCMSLPYISRRLPVCLSAVAADRLLFARLFPALSGALE